MNFRHVCRFLSLLLVCAAWWEQTPVLAQLKAEKKIEITAPTTAIRKFPSDMYKAVGTAKKGETYRYYGITQSGWYQIHYHGDLAYIKASDAKPLRPAVQKQQKPKELAAKQPAEQKTGAAVEETVPAEKSGAAISWGWIAVVGALILLYLFFSIRHARQQREFEEFLRHRPST